MSTLYLAADPVEAHLLRDHLARHGIEVDLFDLMSWGGRGDLAVNTYPRVSLRDPRQEAQALALLRDWEADRSHIIDWQCACGEPSPETFEQCWACGAARPEGGGADGA